MTDIESGKLFLITTGEYSDYSVHTLCRALKDIDSKALTEEYLLSHEEQRERYAFEEDAYVKWLCDKGVVEEVAYQEWFLGGYSSLDDMRVSNGGDE